MEKSRKIVTFLVGNWPARIYLLVVAASVAFAVIALATDNNPDANLAGVWPFFATMPWSLLLIGFVPDEGAGPLLVGVLVVGALANLATIGWVVDLVRPRPRPDVSKFSTGPAR